MSDSLSLKYITVPTIFLGQINNMKSFEQCLLEVVENSTDGNEKAIVDAITKSFNALDPKYKKERKIQDIKSCEWVKELRYEFTYETDQHQRENGKYRGNPFIIIDGDGDPVHDTTLQRSIESAISLNREVAESQCWDSRHDKRPLIEESFEIGWTPFEVTKDKWKEGKIGHMTFIITLDTVEKEFEGDEEAIEKKHREDHMKDMERMRDASYHW